MNSMRIMYFITAAATGTLVGVLSKKDPIFLMGLALGWVIGMLDFSIILLNSLCR